MIDLKDRQQQETEGNLMPDVDGTHVLHPSKLAI